MNNITQGSTIGNKKLNGLYTKARSNIHEEGLKGTMAEGLHLIAEGLHSNN